MDYILAKQLKDAGFPEPIKARMQANVWLFNKKENRWYPGDKDFIHKYKNNFFDKRKWDFEKYIYIPTLSELIEECGDKFGQLIKYDPDKAHLFVAIGEYPRWEMVAESKVIRTEPYPTPEEAVANLWLALNKK